MDKIPKLEIEIKNFRAIKHADIILNGITVIAGINGCGKSTISKLLYRTIRTSIDFNKIVSETLYNELNDIGRILEELSHELDFFIRRNSEKNKLFKEEYELRFRFNRLFNLNDDLDLKEQEKRLLSAIDLLNKAFSEAPKEFEKERFHTRLYRIERYFSEEFFEKDKNNKEIDIPALLNKVKGQVKTKFQKAYNTIEERPINVLDATIEDYFTEDIKVNNYNIKELGALITNRKDKKLSNFLSINKVAYIDTPMSVGIERIGMVDVPHWQDLDALLKTSAKGKISQKSKVGNILKNEIINGETKYDSKSETFIYKRKDGFEIDLFSCATGLKSFSLLQILYNNGFLDNKTLLIIDEPETHLHPEWIVQYARLIVMLHKELKVNFLIGSHSTDMVMALKYISKKELKNETEPVNFYLAQPIDNYEFDYKLFETDIESIFQSFNASLDKINQFGLPE